MPRIESVERIWDRSPHNAFTDLVRFQGRWWCTFREADAHGGCVGAVRVIVSDDGSVWESSAVLSEESVDLRDPKLSVMPDGRLMLLAGGSLYNRSSYLTRAPRVSFSVDGREWTAPRRLLAEDHWLWRATWHNGRAYALSKLGEGDEPRRGFLYSSTDALTWEWITELKLPGISETTLRFLPNDEMVALVRPGYIGSARPPYSEWKVHELDGTIGGPNLIRLPDGSLWGSGRHHDASGQPHTVLATITPTSYEPVLTLPSGGDSSYPGLVWHDELLWMSYYSSHEGRASIYLAKIQV